MFAPGGTPANTARGPVTLACQTSVYVMARRAAPQIKNSPP
jgi:hypothetical protein